MGPFQAHALSKLPSHSELAVGEEIAIPPGTVLVSVTVCDVGVIKIRHQLTLLLLPASSLSNTNISSIK